MCNDTFAIESKFTNYYVVGGGGGGSTISRLSDAHNQFILL